MINIISSRRFLAPALAGAALLGAGAASAQELREGQAAVTQLAPNASAVTYFVDRPTATTLSSRSNRSTMPPLTHCTSRRHCASPAGSFLVKTIDISLPDALRAIGYGDGDNPAC